MATIPQSHFIHDAENFALSVGHILGGLACLSLGGVLTMTLFLLPVGVPIALFGVALLVTTGQGKQRG
jgi:hypothetical protein